MFTFTPGKIVIDVLSFGTHRNLGSGPEKISAEVYPSG